MCDSLTSGDVTGYDVLTADTLQLRVWPWQVAEWAGAQAFWGLFPSVRLAHHELNLLLVLVRDLRPATSQQHVHSIIWGCAAQGCEQQLLGSYRLTQLFTQQHVIPRAEQLAKTLEV